MFTALWQTGASRLSWWLAGIGLVLLAGLVGAPAIERIPLESHEVFVVQSTREMAARTDWLTPWFNGAPRLNKPPMNYWLTGAVAAIDGSLPTAEAGHARAVSVLAGMGMVAIALWLGAVLFDRQTAGLAALLLASSAGLVTYAHNARPDMLYAFWVSLLLASAVVPLHRAREAADSLPGIGQSALMWFAFIGATLTKGPHVPLMVLAGVVLAAWRQQGRVLPVLRTLRLGGGVMAVSLLCGGWWLWLRLQLDGGALGGSQLGGSLLMPSLSRLGNPYYFYRPLQLLVPWLPLLVPGALLFCLPEARRGTGWLWWPLLVTCGALSLGRQYRYFYLLPLLVPLCLLAARAFTVGLASSATRWVRPLLWFVLLLQTVLVLGAAGWVLVRSGRAGWLTPSLLGLVLALTVAGVVVFRLRALDRRYTLLVGLALVVAGLWPGAALNGLLWAKERYESAQLAAEAARVAGGDTPIVTYGLSPTLYVHAANRRVRHVNSPERLAALLASAPGERLVLVTSSDRLPELPPALVATERARTHHGGREEVLLVTGK